MLLIDPPRWPAHGTLFSHLVSDTSLAELHAGAERAGVPMRAFDHDHYDVRAADHDRCVAAGAKAVRAETLVRRLVASGLRVRSPERLPSRVRVAPVLRARWAGLGLPAALGEDLLRRWSERSRHYHDTRHLAQVLASLGEIALATPAATALPTVLAAWFHDAVYEGRPDDEERSATLAESSLRGVVPAGEMAEVARLVRLTVRHEPAAGDAAGEALCDADLAVLATVAGRYDTYVRDVRLDYEHVPDAQWRTGRGAVLRQLLALEPLFRTPVGRSWEPAARANLVRESARWAG